MLRVTRLRFPTPTRCGIISGPAKKAGKQLFMLARQGCPHCARAKELLSQHGIAYEAVHLGQELSMQGVKAASGAPTVPQIFINGRLIGGAEPACRLSVLSLRSALTPRCS